MARPSLKFGLAVGLLAFSGCGLLQVSQQASETVSKYFEAIHEHRYDDALLLYSPLFFEKTSKEKWRTLLTKVGGKLGDFKNYEVANWQVTGSNSGTYTTIICNVKYAKYDATETFTVYQSSGGAATIVAHNISSDGMLLE